jgi:hypothetical protein
MSSVVSKASALANVIFVIWKEKSYLVMIHRQQKQLVPLLFSIVGRIEAVKTFQPSTLTFVDEPDLLFDEGQDILRLQSSSLQL